MAPDTRKYGDDVRIFKGAIEAIVRRQAAPALARVPAILYSRKSFPLKSSHHDAPPFSHRRPVGAVLTGCQSVPTADEIDRMRAWLEDTLSKHSGKPVEQVRRDIERDKILTAPQAPSTA